MKTWTVISGGKTREEPPKWAGSNCNQKAVYKITTENPNSPPGILSTK